jgi:hypothetical protein
MHGMSTIEKVLESAICAANIHPRLEERGLTQKLYIIQFGFSKLHYKNNCINITNIALFAAAFKYVQI